MNLSKRKMQHVIVALISITLLHCHSSVNLETVDKHKRAQEITRANQRIALMVPSVSSPELSTPVLVSSPKIKMYAAPRVAATGGSFRIVVTDQDGNIHEWTNVHIYVPGTFTLGVHTATLTPFFVGPGSVIHTNSNYYAYCTIEVRDDVSYDNQVAIIKNRYGKSAAWENWMKSTAVKARYENVWKTASVIPTTFSLAVEYGGSPVDYDPPWSSEAEHMQRLTDLAEKEIPSLKFDFRFGADPADTNFALKIRGLGTTSGNFPEYIYVYNEPIFSHEWSHVIFLKHHYEGTDTSNKIFLPPGETLCIQARNHNQFCSGCRAAMHLDLNAENGSEIDQIAGDFIDRYPD